MMNNVCYSTVLVCDTLCDCCTVRDEEDKESQEVRNMFSVYLEKYLAEHSVKKKVLACIVNILVSH